MKFNRLIYILLLLVLINTNINSVKAYDSSSCNNETSACAVCSYSIKNNFTIDFLVKSNSNTVSFREEFKNTSSLQKKYSISSIKNTDFISNGKIKCPDNIRYNSTKINNEDNIEFSFSKGSIKLSLNSKSYNNDKTIISNKSNVENSSNTNNSKNNINSSNTNNNLADNLQSPITSKKSNNGIPVTGCEILGSEFYEYLKAIFFWIQVFGPILALILSMTDIMKAVASGDDDAKKKAFKKFPKRIIAAIILLLAPYIVELLLSLIDNVNGTICGL